MFWELSANFILIRAVDGSSQVQIAMKFYSCAVVYVESMFRNCFKDGNQLMTILRKSGHFIWRPLGHKKPGRHLPVAQKRVAFFIVYFALVEVLIVGEEKKSPLFQN